MWFVLLFSHGHSGRSVWTGTTYGRTNAVMHGLAMVSTWCVVWKYGTLFMDSYSIFYVACIGLRDHLTHVRLNSFLLANEWLTARSTSEHGWENAAFIFLFYPIVSFWPACACNYEAAIQHVPSFSYLCILWELSCAALLPITFLVHWQIIESSNEYCRETYSNGPLGGARLIIIL